LINSDYFSKVMEFFDLRERVDLRKLSHKMAFDLVPKTITHLKCEFKEEENCSEHKFPKHIRHASKIEIKNICGTLEHAKKIEEIGKNQVGDIEYLYLDFKESAIPQKDSEDVAR
jgi:hypothetical protein